MMATPSSFTQSGGTGATFTSSINASGNYPGCCCYFQQRKCFAGSTNSPQTVWMTQPADYDNMDVTNPSQESDAITFTIAGNQVNTIKQLLPMNNLLYLHRRGNLDTSYRLHFATCAGNTIQYDRDPAVVHRIERLTTIAVNWDILYNQIKGSVVRDLSYNFWVNIYTGTDMSVLSQHLFFGHNMERWAYAEQPWYQIWVVRDDGVLLSFTYLKEQNVYAGLTTTARA